MFKNKNILVTGGSGMIGRQLVDLLLEEEANITIADLTEPTDLLDKVTFTRANLLYFDQCENICKDRDYIFNLVGIKCSPQVAVERPADVMGPMMQFNTNMLEAAMKADVGWYLYTSTVGVYQPAEILYEDDVWTTMPSKNDWYGGWSKRMGELQCEAYGRQYGTSRCSIVRPANVYGPHDNFDLKSAMVVPSLIRKAYDNDVLEVWGDGSPIRDFVHARDVARGMIHVVKNKITQPVNLGTGTGHAIEDVANIVSEYFNVPIAWDISKPSGDVKRIFDMTRAFESGFQLTVPINTGINSTCNWFVENVNSMKERYAV
jgi:GDP-L-fucose synthase